MTDDRSDPFGSSTTRVPVTVVRAQPWPVWAAIGLATLAAVVGAAEQLGVVGRSATLSVAAYVAVLVGGSALLGRYRWVDGHLSRRPGYRRSPRLQRLAVVAAVLIVVACALTGLVASTEWSKG